MGCRLVTPLLGWRDRSAARWRRLRHAPIHAANRQLTAHLRTWRRGRFAVPCTRIRWLEEAWVNGCSPEGEVQDEMVQRPDTLNPLVFTPDLLRAIERLQRPRQAVEDSELALMNRLVEIRFVEAVAATRGLGSTLGLCREHTRQRAIRCMQVPRRGDAANSLRGLPDLLFQFFGEGRWNQRLIRILRGGIPVPPWILADLDRVGLAWQAHRQWRVLGGAAGT